MQCEIEAFQNVRILTQNSFILYKHPTLAKRALCLLPQPQLFLAMSRNSEYGWAICPFWVSVIPAFPFSKKTVSITKLK